MKKLTEEKFLSLYAQHTGEPKPLGLNTINLTGKMLLNFVNFLREISDEGEREGEDDVPLLIRPRAFRGRPVAEVGMVTHNGPVRPLQIDEVGLVPHSPLLDYHLNVGADFRTAFDNALLQGNPASSLRQSELVDLQMKAWLDDPEVQRIGREFSNATVTLAPANSASTMITTDQS